jgi:hypothetical protein
MFDVRLIQLGPGRWAAQLADGTVIVESSAQPRAAAAAALMRMGADPRSYMVVRRGVKVLAFDTLGHISGSPVTCTDEGAMSREQVRSLVR